MESFLSNWKTTAGGIVTMLLALMSLLGVSVPGVPAMDPGAAWTALVAGVTLIFAKDHNK